MPTIDHNFQDDAFFTDCFEVYDGVREGTARGMDGRADHVRVFKVVVKAPEMSEVGVAMCSGIPKLGSFYIPPPVVVPPDAPPGYPTRGIAWDSLAMLYKISARQQDRDDSQVWLVTCLYTRDIPIGFARSSDPEKSRDDPTMEGAEIFWDWETAQEACQFDLNGVPYLNMANQPFSPPKMRVVRYRTLTISRNEAGPDPLKEEGQSAAFIERLSKLNDALNDADFLGAPPGCVQCDAPKAVLKNRGVLVYYNVTYKLKFRPLQARGGYIKPPINVIIEQYDPISDFIYRVAYKGKTDFVDSWQPLELNQGMYRLGSKDANDLQKVWGLPVPIMKYGQQVHHPVLLDEKGQEAKSKNVTNTRLTTDPPPGGGTLDNNTITNRIEPWYIQFIEFPSVSLDDLLVEGL